MKKVTTIISILTTAAILASLTGCSSGTSDPSSDSQITSPVSDNNNSADNSGLESSVIPGGSDNPDSDPEPQKPDGEPTFLTAPDGTPIYTSEITKYQDPSEFHGTHEQYPLDSFNRETFTGWIEDPEIVCDGFAYAFIPRFIDTEDPGKLTENELPPSSEYFRLKVGDSFGGLTVKSAYASFSNYNARWYDGDPDEIHGIYFTGAEIEYEGEVEMTGCIAVMKTEGYETEGNLWFYPDGGSSSKIPAAHYQFDTERKSVYHSAFSGSTAYSELLEMTLGNMYDYSDVDFDGLEPGDYVRVKITVKDPVVSARYGYMSCWGDPAAVEVLR